MEGKKDESKDRGEQGESSVKGRKEIEHCLQQSEKGEKEQEYKKSLERKNNVNMERGKDVCKGKEGASG